MNSRSTAGVATEEKTSWLPMAAIAMGQAQMSWNINALPVSIGGISAEFSTAPTTVVTAIVAYSLFLVGEQLFISWTQSRQAAGQAPLLPALAKRQHAVQGIAVPSYSGRIEKIETVPIESRPAIVQPPIGSSAWSARALRRLIPRRI